MIDKELIVRREGAAGILSLNRPRALHALTLGMNREMTEALLDWRVDPAVKVVILDHAEGRGFCAGGDINLLRQSAIADDGAAARQFFFEEYQLNHLLFTYGKPIAAFMNGITMGGGVGMSQPATIRVATEHTRFSMPETGIGLLPDVGGGWYLSRLGGRLGEYLALTGSRLYGAECLWAGIATHYVPADRIDQAKSWISAGRDLQGVLAVLAVTAPKPRIAENARSIARHFASDRLEDVLISLETDDSDWAATALASIRAKSPTACKVALRQLATSRKLSDFAENMAMEYRAASRMIMLPDFSEGVRALIVDKDNTPQWRPSAPEDITDEDLSRIFAELPAEDEWKPF